MLWMFQRVNYGAVTNEKNRSLPDLTPREWAMMVPTIAMCDRHGRAARRVPEADGAVGHARSIERVTGRNSPARRGVADHLPGPVPPGERRSQLPAHAAMPIAAPGRPSQHPRAAGRERASSEYMTDYAAIIPIVMRRAGRRLPPCSPKRSASRASGCRSPGSASSAWSAPPSRRSCSGTRDAHSFGVIRADNFALFINLILCIVGILTMLFSDDVVERERMPAGEYYALTLFAHQRHDADGGRDRSAGHLPRARDPVARRLRADRHPPGERGGAEAAFKYFLLGAFSSAFFLYGIAFAFALSGSTRLDQIGAALSRAGRAATARSSRCSRSGCSPSASRSRSPRCRSTCGRRTPTKARRRSSRRSCPPASRRRRLPRSSACSCRRSSRSRREWIPILSVIAAADDDPRHGRRRGADQRQADARVFEHRARRLPAARHRRGEQRPARPPILFYLLAYAVTNLGALGIVALLGTAGGSARRAARFRRPVANRGPGWRG